MGPWIASLSLPALFAAVVAFFLGLTVISTGFGFALERALRSRRIWDVPLDPGQYRFELVGNLAYLGVQIVAFTAALHLGLLRFDDGASALLTFFVIYFGFQLYYYWLHRLMHRRRWVHLHRWHHRSRVTTPLSGQSMSVGEAIGWAIGYLGVPALAGLWIPISAEGFVAYVAFNVYGNIVGHANVEMVNPLARARLVSIFTPPFIYHALHHARWTGHYGFASTGLDRLFRTEFADWRAIAVRVDGGTPLRSLKERIEV
ncbi:MAG: sterol desaturase family protein [Nannocystaceae bacterium]